MNSESNQIFWTQWNHGIAITRMKSFGIWVFGSIFFRTWLNSHWVVSAILVGYLNSKFHQIVNSVKQLQCNKSLFKWLRIFLKKKWKLLILGFIKFRIILTVYLAFLTLLSWEWAISLMILIISLCYAE